MIPKKSAHVDPRIKNFQKSPPKSTFLQTKPSQKPIEAEDDLPDTAIEPLEEVKHPHAYVDFSTKTLEHTPQHPHPFPTSLPQESPIFPYESSHENAEPLSLSQLPEWYLEALKKADGHYK
ncbi:unnamed protein product [Moneuplotes crassus]|uniref:Uncharacterized protein n=1 Tax=Euplotes crassus TaxID=5936 RepID=A0AAD1Y565_EUPCR|nr:unnamed protein product [Moneuplotes crassus]